MKTGIYLHKWLNAFVVPFKAANTATCYRQAIQSLPSEILETELEQLDMLDLQGVLNNQAVEHSRAAQLTYTTLHVAFNDAVAGGYMPRNIMDACKKPKHEKRKSQAFTPDQLKLYMDAAKAESCYVLLLLMATCGLRRGEALGLTWQHVDFANHVLRVREQRMRCKGAYTQKPLKTKSSIRDILLPDEMLDILRECRLRAFERPNKGYIHDMTPEALYYAHKRVKAAAGVPEGVTLHGLRHSMASILAETGTSIKVLQVLLGHANYQTTADIYADHLTSTAYAPDVARIVTMVL